MTDDNEIWDDTGRDFGDIAPWLSVGELDALARETGTDKSSTKHDYMRFYEAVLTPYRDSTFTMLELGVGIPSRKAPSLRTWKAFFPRAEIVGVDIRKVSKEFEEDRIHVELGDISKPRVLRRIFNRWKPSIVVDDASHFWSHQITGFKTLFPMLPPGGVYICEDVQTSFGAYHGESKFADQPESFWEFIARLQTGIAAGRSQVTITNRGEQRLVAWIDAILLSRKTVAIIKRQSVYRRDLPRSASKTAE